MYCPHVRTAEPLFRKHRALFLFPVKTRLGDSRPVSVMAIALLLSLTSGLVYSAQAEPSVAARPNRELAANPFSIFVAEAAQRFGLPTLWIDAVMMVESAGDVRAVSPQGAMGLMQIMPETWEDLRTRYDLGPDPFDPHDNILAGAAYMREMHDRYGSPGFLAAYNTGPQRYEEYLTTGRELPLETQVYVATLAPMIGAPQVGGTVAMALRETPWQESALFAARRPHGLLAGLSPLAPSDRASGEQSSAGQPALQPRPDGLFVGRASARALQ
jgi:soluble lytic murein transglycosylase-like protein